MNKIKFFINPVLVFIFSISIAYFEFKFLFFGKFAENYFPCIEKFPTSLPCYIKYDLYLIEFLGLLAFGSIIVAIIKGIKLK